MATFKYERSSSYAIACFGSSRCRLDLKLVPADARRVRGQNVGFMPTPNVRRAPGATGMRCSCTTPQLSLALACADGGCCYSNDYTRRKVSIMPSVEIRKFVTQVEEIWHEGGPRADNPAKRGAIAAVIANPYAGRYVEAIVGYMDDLKPL